MTTTAGRIDDLEDQLRTMAETLADIVAHDPRLQHKAIEARRMAEVAARQAIVNMAGDEQIRALDALTPAARAGFFTALGPVDSAKLLAAIPDRARWSEWMTSSTMRDEVDLQVAIRDAKLPAVYRLGPVPLRDYSRMHEISPEVAADLARVGLDLVRVHDSRWCTIEIRLQGARLHGTPGDVLILDDRQLAALHRADPTLQGEIDAGYMATSPLGEDDTIRFCRDRQRRGLPVFWRP